MNAKEFEALVNKGAITQVGVAADIEKLSDKEICEKFVTKHEVAAEILSGETEDTAPVAPETPETPVEPETLAEATTEEVTVPAKKSKKASKAKVEPDAPVVDPVEE